MYRKSINSCKQRQKKYVAWTLMTHNFQEDATSLTNFNHVKISLNFKIKYICFLTRVMHAINDSNCMLYKNSIDMI